MNRLIAQYGLALVFANVLLEQIGLPIPAIPALVVAGVLAAEGKLSAWAIFGVAFVACMIGDGLWYVAGRRWGPRVMKLLCRMSLSPDTCVRQTEVRFERWGGLTLVLSKFIPGLSTIAPPLAGAMRLSWPSFLLLNSLGIVIWAGIAIVAGIAFHAQINELILRLEDLGMLAIEIIAVLLGGYITLKWWERRRFYKMLRIARITVDELRVLMSGGSAPWSWMCARPASGISTRVSFPAPWPWTSPRRKNGSSSCRPIARSFSTAPVPTKLPRRPSQKN